MGALKAYGMVQIKSKVGAVVVNWHFDAAMNLFSYKILGRFFQIHSKFPQTDRDWNIWRSDQDNNTRKNWGINADQRKNVFPCRGRRGLKIRFSIS